MTMKNKQPQVQHRIGDAVITEESAAQLAEWQSHDNDGIDGKVCDLLKAVSFIACLSSEFSFDEKSKAESMQHIITLSELARDIEVFKK